MTDKETKVTEVEEKLDDITECSICMSTCKEPKILSCIHSFCLACLQQSGTNSGKAAGSQMPCPMCRKEFTIPETGYDGLQRSFFIERLIKMKQILKLSSGEFFCDECQEETEGSAQSSSVAEVYCTDCNLKLCSDCHKHHKRSKTSKHHHITSLHEEHTATDKGLFQNTCVLFCEEHKQKPLEFYCNDCQNVACGMCFMEHHNGHKVSDVNEASTGFRQEMERNVNSLSSIMGYLEEKRNQLEYIEIIFNDSVKEIKIRVQKKRDELMEVVDMYADAVLLNLEALKENRLKENEVKNDDIETLLSCLQSYNSYCKEMTTAGSSVDVCREMNTLSSRALELRQLHEIACQKISKLNVLALKTGLSNPLETCEMIIGKLEEYDDTEVCDEAQCNVKEMKPRTDEEQRKEMETIEREEAGVLLTTDKNEFLNSEVARLQSEKKYLEQQIGLLKHIAYGRVKTTNQSETSRFNWRNGLRFHSTLKIFTAESETDYRITGIATLESELFVSSKRGEIVVYDMQTLRFRRRFCLKDFTKIEYLTQCKKQNWLYIKAKEERNTEIIIVDSMGCLKGKWPVKNTVGQLSVTPESNVLVVVSRFHQECILHEYTPDGALTCIIRNTWDSGKKSPSHAIKLTSCHYALSHAYGVCTWHGIYIIDADGVVLKSYRDSWGQTLLESPCFLDVDGNGNILVADQGNSRLLLLSSDLELVLTQPLPTDKRFHGRPKRVMFDECHGRVFVAVSRSSIGTNFEIEKECGDELEILEISS